LFWVIFFFVAKKANFAPTQNLPFARASQALFGKGFALPRP
jgi:hypothetical protein